MKRRTIAIWLLVISMLVPNLAFGAEASEDTHWGIERMKKWQDKGLINGYPDGSLRPDEGITRAQFARMLRSVFQYAVPQSTVEQKSFTDVEAGGWYSKDVAAAAAAGIINGYPDGSFRPNELVKRQDAATMLAAAYKLKEQASLAAFKDAGQVSSYAQQPVQQLVHAGVLKGYSDGTIRPMNTMTRAEAIALLDGLTGELIQDKGTVSNRTIEGNLVVQSPDVKLEGVNVTGSVYVAPGVGDGDLHLKDVHIDGTLHINGGGVDSIYIDNSTANTIVVNRLEGKVRIVITNESNIGSLYVERDTIIELDQNSIIKLLSFLEGSKGSQLKADGKIEQLLNAAGVELPGQPGSGTDSGSDGGYTPTPQPTRPPVDEWKLVWSDEFDRSGENLDDNGVDLDKWGYQLGTGSQYGLDGWGNDEQQYYRAENIKVEDGFLKITAQHEQFEDKPYTSGRIFTEPTFSQTYGKFEARMKLPAGQGLWPAFWMMPVDSVYGTWAASGEIDIMEAKGRLLNEIGGAIHYGRNWPNNKFTAETYHFPEGRDITDFNVYGLEWEPGELRWYVNGQLYQKLNNWDSWGDGQPAKYAFPAPFDQPFYMILNLAVGGNYDGGRLPQESDLPAEMLVDYVRVYELTGREYREATEPSIEVEPIEAPYKEAVNGSYVYDPQYEQDVKIVTSGDQSLDEMNWNFVYLDQFGGAAKLDIKELDGTKLAKTSIQQPGYETHAVQLIQHVTLGKGRWYKLSFDARSDANRSMAVKLGGGESRGWSVYSDNYDIQLTNSLQRFERVFQMSADTDKLARLEFNMGVNASPVWIGNVKLEEIEALDPFQEFADKEPLANGNHIYNGSFDLGRMDRLTYWSSELAEETEAAFSVDVVKRELHVNIVKGGEAASDVVFQQQGVQAVGGNDYELSFNARADQPRTIQVALLKEDGTINSEPQSVSLAEENERYSVTFSIEGEGAVSYGKLAFWLGGEAVDVYLDDIVLLRTTDNFIGELPLEHQFPLKNGDFSNETENWNEHVQGRYDGWDLQSGYSVEDDVLRFKVSSTGNEPWDVMLAQAGLDLKNNQTYIVSLDAKASHEREVELILETSNYARHLEERLAITEDWKTYSFELPMTQDALLDFKLLLGKLKDAAELPEHDVWIDNVRVEVKDARSKAFFAVNGYFDHGLDGWAQHVQGVYDGPSRANIKVEDGALRASIEHSGAKPWDIVLFQEAAVSLKKGETYVVSFVARASEERTIDAIVENSTYMRSLNQPVKLTKDAQRYSYEFTMERDELVQLKFLFGHQDEVAGEIGSDVAHIVEIDNVLFERKGAREAAGELAREQHELHNG